ncbi:MAG TPA: amino acid adenylation domain-containing protein, partial [Gemmatimonadales bacterium]|nr:amino acid adenylation domain-containing protein [Gemmatimonadales bacterium]
RTMMEYHALDSLAREVDRLVAARAATQGAPAPARQAAAPTIGESAVSTLRADPHFAPVTPEQRLLWEIERASPGTSAYNLPICRRIEGPLDLHVLAAALEDLAARHDAFRTSIEEDSVARAQRIDGSVHLPIEVLDFRRLAPGEAEPAALAALDARVARPFDLTRAPLCRVTVARIADQDTLLLLTMHHLVCDGWSAELILSQLVQAYAARAAGRAPAPEESGRDFGDYAAWLAAPERAAARRQHLEYWRTLLDDADLSVDLPSDHPRPLQPTFEGHRQRVVLPSALLAELDRRAKEHETTLNVLLLASFRILLYRLGNQEDLTFGTVLAGRDSLDVERTIGYFARTVLVRTRVTETTTLAQLVRDVRTGILDALDHPASLEEVVGVMRRPMDWAFRLLFSFNEDYRSEPHLGAARMTPVSIGTPGAKVDLGLAVSRRAEGLEVVLTTRAAQYESSTTGQLLQIYQTLLEGVAGGGQGPVSRLSLFRQGERERVLSLAAGPVRPTRAARPLGELFLEEAVKHPERTALLSAGASWTFGAVAEHAGRLANDIARRGIGPGDVVAIVSRRTPEMVMAMVAVVLAGAAYLPLDSEQPADRIRGMLEDAGVKLVLADAAGAAVAEDRAPVQRLDAIPAPFEGSATALRRPRPEDPVYVMFTSGSTGRPKGVVVPHRALVNHMDWALAAFPIEATDVILQRTPLGFDASIWEVWGSLLAGCPMVLADPDRDFDPHYIREMIRSHGITTLQLVPSVLNLLLELDGLADCPTLRRVLSGGERLPVDLARRFHAAHDAVLINLYGPTEVTIDATSWRSHPGFSGSSIPIGRPIPNLSAYVLDSNREPRPLGIPGELYLGGLGVALGYVNRPDLTAERFLPDPFGAAGTSMYRTGDRALLRPDGTIEYLGRVDEQLKLHGFRIEPGEVESVLNARSEVRECAVGVAWGETDGARLMAWVVLHPGATTSAGTLREELARSLPRSLIPSGIVFLDELPKTPSGKIDRRALPAPRSDSLPFEPPRTPTEHRVAEVWMAVLGRDRIGRDDDLFALGGHSLTAIRIAHQLRGPDTNLSLRTILEHPTVASLATEIDRQAGPAPGSNATIPPLPRIPRAPRPGKTPLPPPVR